jgi:histidinol-phosphate aminotransferase
MFSLERLVRPHIVGMKPYSSARDEYQGTEGIFLDANENSIASATKTNFSRYPDPACRAVKAAMEPIFGVKASQILLGNGSDEPIDLLIRLFCRPNVDNILLLPPTYGMYKVSAVLNEVTMKNVPLTEDFSLDVDMIFKAMDSNTKIIFVCSPNNPTGNSLDVDDLQRILKNYDGIVVIDQAYADFAPHADFTHLLAEYPNLVILKTFSKAWGMAALRLGMAFASDEIISLLNKIKPPYNINIGTQKEALLALNNHKKVLEMIATISEQRKLLITQLRTLENVVKVYPSDTNFLLVRFKDSANVFEYLIANKIIVRDRSHEINCDSCLRITVGNEAENKKLIEILSNYTHKQ